MMQDIKAVLHWAMQADAYPVSILLHCCAMSKPHVMLHAGFHDLSFPYKLKVHVAMGTAHA